MARHIGRRHIGRRHIGRRHIGRRGKYVLDVLHYTTSLGWLGVGSCQLTLNVVALVTGDPVLRHAAHEITHTFDRYLLIALAVGSITSGVLLGTTTKWGLVRYWWVLVKLVLCVAMLIFTPIWMGGWIGDAVTLTADPAALADPDYLVVRRSLFTGSVGIVTTLLLITVISVVRPWGRVRPNRRSTVLTRDGGAAYSRT
ncbi:hypothetical protein WEH80_38370 [Actinomycetes bacterium KLBMP 9759]